MLSETGHLPPADIVHQDLTAQNMQFDLLFTLPIQEIFPLPPPPKKSFQASTFGLQF